MDEDGNANDSACRDAIDLPKAFDNKNGNCSQGFLGNFVEQACKDTNGILHGCHVSAILHREVMASAVRSESSVGD